MKKLFKIYLFAACMMGFLNLAHGQSYDLSPEAQEKMEALSFLVGNWKGSGWMIIPDQQRHTFEQSEKVEMRLSGTHLMIEGKGISNGKVIHNALAIISPKEEGGQFSFTSFLQSGSNGTFKAELKERVLYWYPTEQVRYAIQINESGQWHEIGEYNMGTDWFQFFEMTLEKVD